MSKGYVNLVGAVAGWALGGPVGAFLANAGIGFFERLLLSKTPASSKFSKQYSDLSICVLVLLKYVILSDKRIKKVEMTFVRSYLISEFGSEALEIGTKAFIDLEDVKDKATFQKICWQINENTDIKERIQLIHLLFKAANADKVVTVREENRIHHLVVLLKISEKEYLAIKAMYVFERKQAGKKAYAKTRTKRLINAYAILQLESTCTDLEIKKSFRNLAKSNHPDKFSYLGKEQADLAEERFQKILEAYEYIKLKRGIK